MAKGARGARRFSPSRVVLQGAIDQLPVGGGPGGFEPTLAVLFEPGIKKHSFPA